MDYDRNWRNKIGSKRNPNELTWRISLHAEYVEFLLEVEKLAKFYNWGLWGGGVNNYAITLSQSGRDGISISVRLHSMHNYKYYASFENEWNPNNVSYDSYKTYVSDSLDEALKYIHLFIQENKSINDYENSHPIVLGGAYERFPLAYKWAVEERDGVLL